MKAATLGELARTTPEARVRLFFRNDAGNGTLDTTAEHAANPNLSQRFFPPDDTNAADLGWAQPYWHASECYRILVLEPSVTHNAPKSPSLRGL